MRPLPRNRGIQLLATIKNEVKRTARNFFWPMADLIYSPADVNDTMYNAHRHDRELEHQYGRLRNYRTIIREIRQQNLPGEFIEFGIWKAFSVLWIAYFLEQQKIVRRFTGVDSFLGFINDDGVFKKGQMTSSSKKLCEDIVRRTPVLGPMKNYIGIYQALFEEKEKMHAIIAGRKFVFLHIDCDIGSAAEALFARLEETDCLAKTCYLLFDDYGCESSIGGVIDAEIKRLEEKWTVTEHSKTDLTKNFRLEKRNW